MVSPAATASASPRSGSRSRGTPGFDLSPTACSLRAARRRARAARSARSLDDQIAQGDNPTQVAFRLFSEALYGTHPYARDVLGTAARSTLSIARALAAFYRERYPISALTLAIVGDVDVDDVVARVTKRFGAVEARRPPPPTVAPPTLRRPQRRASARSIAFLDRAQAHLVVGFPGATVDAKDRFALEVLVAVLGGQSGRLFGELRDKQGLVYRVSAHSVEGVDPGFVAIYLSCAPDKLDGRRRRRARRARSRARGRHHRRRARARAELPDRQPPDRDAAPLVGRERDRVSRGVWPRLETWASYDDAIRAVTLDAVAAAAATYLRADRAITATVRRRCDAGREARKAGRRHAARPQHRVMRRARR